MLHEPLDEARVRVTCLILAEEIVQMFEHICARWTASTRRIASAAEFETRARPLRTSFLTVAPFLLLVVGILLGHFTRHSFHNCGFIVIIVV